MATKKKEVAVEIVEMNVARLRVHILGTTPFVCNRMSQKVIQGLLMPAKRKNMAERESTLKHDPIAEYRASPYTDAHDDAPTLIQFLAVAFKRALAGAALDAGGARKSQIGRRCWIQGIDGGERVALFGVPEILCAIVRSADINKTPDVRTRAILPKWACALDVSFTSPLLNERDMMRLLSVAGKTQGVGDGRVEKGALTYGQFEIVSEDDPRYVDVIKRGGRAAQVAAMANPVPYDDETGDLLAWFEGESDKRGMKRTVVSDAA